MYNKTDQASKCWEGPLYLKYPENHDGHFKGDLISCDPDFQSIQVGEEGTWIEFLLFNDIKITFIVCRILIFAIWEFDRQWKKLLYKMNLLIEFDIRVCCQIKFLETNFDNSYYWRHKEKQLIIQIFSCWNKEMHYHCVL